MSVREIEIPKNKPRNSSSIGESPSNSFGKIIDLTIGGARDAIYATDTEDGNAVVQEKGGQSTTFWVPG
jgi:hypothetical protein